MDDWQKKIGVPVASLSPHTVEDVKRDITLLGAWLGCNDQARILVAKLKPQAATRQAGRTLPTVFIETQRSPLWVAGKNTLVSDAVQRGGFQNVTNTTGYHAYNLESLLAHPPDVYLVPTKTPPTQVLRALRADPRLSSLPCIKAGRVIAIDDDLLLRPGPRLFEGVRRLRQLAPR